MKIEIPKGKYCKSFKKSQGCYFLEISENYDEACFLHREDLGEDSFGIKKCKECLNKEPITVVYSDDE